MGKDRNRCRKIQKDRKRYEKMAIDCSLIGEYGFSLVANVHILLNCRFPYPGWSWLVSGLFLGFVSVLLSVLCVCGFVLETARIFVCTDM